MFQTRRVEAALLVLLAIGAAHCSREPSVRAAQSERASTPAHASPSNATGSPATTAAGSAAEWTMAAGDQQNTRFSQLADITRDNVSSLKPVWSFSTGMVAGHEAAPLVVQNTMYLVTPFPNVLYALDLTKPGAPIKWKYEPHPEAAARGVACCDIVNRGAAYLDGVVYYNTLDGNTVAVDANDGHERWRTKLADINKGESITMAPLIADGKVLVGNSGGEFGVRGWLTALDAKSGKQVWRAYSTGPDADVLIGPTFKPFYQSDRGGDLGIHSWPPDAWKIGGGTVWGWVSYDPATGVIYYGTANPGPWNPDQRPGDNKWTAGIFARDASTGAARWFYQFSPHDLYDHDGVNENVLVDATIDGQTRHVLVHPDRNGYVYVLDRENGQVLSATGFVPITASKGVDLTTGRLQEVEDKKTKAGIVVRDICPASPGAKDWQPSSYSPRTKLLYIPHNNLCMDYQATEVNYIAGTPYVGADVVFKPGPGGNRGQVSAWDIVNKRAAWTIKEPLMVWSGTLVTAGDVVFYGTMEGWFKAVDAQSGKLLWQYKGASGIIGQPISYRGPDGKQYIAVFAGIGGWPGGIVVNDLDTRDPTAALGWGEVLRDLKSATTKGGVLYVFALP